MTTEHDVTSPRPIYFGVAVWGQAFCESFAIGALASLLAEGNIPALGNPSGKNTFIIYTRAVDWEWFQRQAIIKRLQQYMIVMFMEMMDISEEAYQALNNPLLSSKLYLMTMGHRQILDKMYTDKAIGSIVIPDSIYSSHSIQSAYQHIANGKQSVLVFCPRFATTAMIDELQEQQYIQPGQPLELTSRELVEVAMRHQHIDIQMQKWDIPYFPEFMLELGWMLPDKSGMLFHTWSCWCAFIDYGQLKTHNMESLGHNTIDGVYWSANITKETTHLITDSDEFTLISYSPHINRRQVPIRRILRAKSIMTPCKVAFAKRVIKNMLNEQTDPFKLEFAHQPIYMHTKDLTPVCLHLAEKTQAIMKDIINHKLTVHDQILLCLNEPHLLKKIVSTMLRFLKLKK